MATASIILIGIIIFCGSQIKNEVSQRKEDADTFEELASMAKISVSEETQTIDDLEVVDETVVPSSYEAGTDLHDISLLKSKNPDCIGWISIPGTAVNYPVMHTPLEPQKYLRLNFYEQYSVSGVPFLDHRCSLQTGNLIIYGHNMKNGTMFAAVKSYRTEGYLQKYPRVTLELEDGVHSFDVFAVVSLNKKDAWYDFIDGASEDDFNDQIQAIIQKAMYFTGETPVYRDRILTLSTCHKNMEIDRLVVLAREKSASIN